MIDCIINLDRKTSCALRQNGSFANSGSSDLVLILGCMTSNLLKYLSFSTLYSSSLRRTHTIIFSKLNKPPVSIKPPLKWASNSLDPHGPSVPSTQRTFFSFDCWRLTHVVFFFVFFFAKKQKHPI